MERIGWIRAVIENSSHLQVQAWVEYRGNDSRWHLWFQEEFLVVIADRGRLKDKGRYFQLITAFDTPQKHQKRKFRNRKQKWTGHK